MFVDMKIAESVETVKIEQQVKKIICNKCGKESDATDYTNTNQEFILSFGYGSNYDNQIWQLDLCEDCLMKIIGEFQIKPEITRKY